MDLAMATALTLYIPPHARAAFLVFVEEFGFLTLYPQDWASIFRTCVAAAAVARAVQGRLPCSCGVSRGTIYLNLAYYRQHMQRFDAAHGRPAFFVGHRRALRMRAWPGPRWWEYRYQFPVLYRCGTGDLLYGFSREECELRHHILCEHGFDLYNRSRMSHAVGFTWRRASFSSDPDLGSELFPVLIHHTGPTRGYQPANAFDTAAIGTYVPNRVVPMFFPRGSRQSLAEQLGI